MMMVGVILWVLMLAWLVSSLHPSQEMRRDTAGNWAYYSLWTILLGSALVGQYHFLAQSGHTMLAVVSASIGIGLGIARLCAMRCFE